MESCSPLFLKWVGDLSLNRENVKKISTVGLIHVLFGEKYDPQKATVRDFCRSMQIKHAGGSS